MENKKRRILVTGGTGFVGGTVTRLLRAAGEEPISIGSRDVDLLDYSATRTFFNQTNPEIVIHCAARVGGVLGNSTFPATFISDNLRIQSNVLEAAAMKLVPKLVFVASSCVYPKNAPLPLKEEYLLTGPFEPTNRWYATAKLAGIMQVEAINIQYGLDWFSVLPTNVYGPRDNFGSEMGHVVPSLIFRFVEAIRMRSNVIEIWGSGKPYREFIHVDDLASAILTLTFHTPALPVPYICNIGTEDELTIFDLAKLIQELSGFKGRLVFDESKPDGVFRKSLDSSILRATGWKPSKDLREGLLETINWVVENFDAIQSRKLFPEIQKIHETDAEA